MARIIAVIIIILATHFTLVFGSNVDDFLSSGKYDKAGAECGKLTNYRAKDKCYNKVADACYKNKKYEEALKYYKKSFNYNGKKKVYEKFGDQYLEQKMFLLAAQNYQKAGKSKKQKDAYGKQAEKYYKDARFEQAGKYFGLAGNDEAKKDAYLKAGEFYLTKHNYKKAESCFISAGDQVGLARVYVKLAEQHEQKKNFALAADYYHKSGNDDKARPLYGKAAAESSKAKDYKLAIEYYTKAGDEKQAAKVQKIYDRIFKVTYLSSSFTGRIALDGLTAMIVILTKPAKLGRKSPVMKDVVDKAYGKKNISYDAVKIKNIKGISKIPSWNLDTKKINSYVKDPGKKRQVYILHYSNWYEHTKRSYSDPLKINITYYYKVYAKGELLKTFSFTHFYQEPKHNKKKQDAARQSAGLAIYNKNKQILNKLRKYLRSVKG